MQRVLHCALAVAVAANVLAVPLAVGVVGASPAGAGSAGGPATAEDSHPADVVYVTEDGDGILEYRASVPDATTTARTGLAVSEEALRRLLVDDDGPEDQFPGGVDATVTPARLVAETSLSGEDAADLRDLRFGAAAGQSDDHSRANLSLSATVDADDPPGGDRSTSGSVDVGPDEYVYTGEVVADAGTAIAEAADGNASLALEETAEGYRLTVERVRTVPDDRRDGWATRENATATLSDRFDAIAADLDGESDLAVDRYETTPSDDGSLRVAVAYTVTYTGVEATLSERIARSLAVDRDLALSPATTDRAADRIAEVGFDRVHAAVETGDGAAVVRWTVGLEEYAALPDAVLSIAEAQADLSETASAELATYRDRLDARVETGLVRTVAWDGRLSADGGGTTVSLSVESGTEGWAAYAAALSDRGIGPVTFGYDVSARTVDDRIATEARLTLEDEALVGRITRSGLDGLDRAGRLSSLAGAFRSAGFDRANLDLSVGDGTLTASGSARFADLAAFSPLVEATVGTQVDGVAARAVSDVRTRYVRVQGLADADPTRDEIRSLPIADADTTIELPGEWDRSFPDSMTVRSAEAMLGIERTTAPATTSESSGGGLPGFGPLLALAALIGGLVGRRRGVRGEG